MNTYDDDDYSLFVGDKKIDGFTDGEGTLFEKRSDAKTSLPIQ